MIPVISIPSIQTVSPVQAITASDTHVAIGSLPVTFVAPSIARPELSNNARVTQQLRSNVNAVSAGLPLFSSYATSAAVPETEEPSLRAGFVSTFVAQALGQSDEGDGQKLATFFASDTTLPINDGAKVAFSLTPFRPSLAALPESISLNLQLSAGPQSVTTPVQVPASVPVQENAPVQLSQNESEADAVSTVTPLPQPAQPKSSGEKKSPSLVTPSGIPAYSATLARNAIHLLPSFAPQIALSH